MKENIGKFLIDDIDKEYDLILAVDSENYYIGVWKEGHYWRCDGGCWEISETIPEGYVRDEQ